MVTVWEDIFRITGIGIDDDFFTLGGDSITGIRLVARANNIGIRLETFHLFECYTIRQIFDKYPEILTKSHIVHNYSSEHTEREWREILPKNFFASYEEDDIEDVYEMTSVQEGEHTFRCASFLVVFFNLQI